MVKSHNKYLKKILGSCFLTERAQNVFLLFTPLFESILSFQQCVSRLKLSTVDGISSEAFKEIEDGIEQFDNYSYFLYDVLSKLAEKGYQNTVDLVTRLDFNGFFQERSLSTKTLKS